MGTRAPDGGCMMHAWTEALTAELFRRLGEGWVMGWKCQGRSDPCPLWE